MLVSALPEKYSWLYLSRCHNLILGYSVDFNQIGDSHCDFISSRLPEIDNPFFPGLLGDTKCVAFFQDNPGNIVGNGHRFENARSSAVPLITFATAVRLIKGQFFQFVFLEACLQQGFRRKFMFLFTGMQRSEQPLRHNQVQQNTKQGMTFARALRAFLRQDPDVIMVGEIRDIETAEIAIKAAQTGHLVLSTLHTNDAAQALDRIIDVFPAERRDQIQIMLAGALQGIISQRLLPSIVAAAWLPMR